MFGDRRERYLLRTNAIYLLIYSIGIFTIGLWKHLLPHKGGFSSIRDSVTFFFSLSQQKWIAIPLAVTAVLLLLISFRKETNKFINWGIWLSVAMSTMTIVNGLSYWVCAFWICLIFQRLLLPLMSPPLVLATLIFLIVGMYRKSEKV